MVCPNRRPGSSTSEAGFSLIELLVVLLIMGIMMAIALPTLLGTTHHSAAQIVEQRLDTAASSADSAWPANNSFSELFSTGGCTPTAPSLSAYLATRNSGIHFSGGNVTGKANTVSVGCAAAGSTKTVEAMIFTATYASSGKNICLGEAEAKQPTASQAWPQYPNVVGTGIGIGNSKIDGAAASAIGGPFFALQSATVVGCTASDFRANATGWRSSWKTVKTP